MILPNYKSIIVIGDSYCTGMEMMDHIFMTSDEILAHKVELENIAWRLRAEACKKYYSKITGKKVKENSNEYEYNLFLHESINFVSQLEKKFSWPTILNLRIKNSVINLAEAGNSYYSNIQTLKNFLKNNNKDKFLLINMIPSHCRVPIWLNGSNQHKDVGVHCLRNDRLWYKLKLIFKNKFKLNEELQVMKQYKHIAKKEQFDSYIESAHKEFLNLQEKYKFDYYIITGQQKTAELLKERFKLDKEKFIKENLYKWGMTNFRSGRTHPNELKYNDKLVKLICNKFILDDIVDIN